MEDNLVVFFLSLYYKLEHNYLDNMIIFYNNQKSYKKLYRLEV